MVTLATVEQQLKAAGCSFRFWGRSEIKELCHILLPGETIYMAVNGQYDAGFAMLCATDFRILLIDKKPKYLTLKDIRYDMITELDFSGRMMNSTVRIYTPNKELRFTTTNTTRLRKLYTHTQHKVMEIRHRFMMQQFQMQHEMQSMPPGVAMSNAIQAAERQPLGGGAYQQPLPAGTQPAQAIAAPAEAPQLDMTMTSRQIDMPAEPKAELPAQDAAAQASLYNPQPADDQSEEHQRLAAFMGAAGLQSIVHNGQVIKEYMTVPFQHRWRKRPYGFSRDSMPTGHQQLPPA
jgi:hypothetical protein